MQRVIHWLLLLGCCEVLPLTRWDAGIIWYGKLLLAITLKQLLMRLLGVPMLIVVAMAGMFALLFCVVQSCEAFMMLRRDHLMGFSQNWSGTPYGGMFGYRGRFSLLVSEPALVVGLVMVALAHPLPEGMGQNFPVLLLFALGVVVNSVDMAHAELIAWLNLGVMPFFPFLLLGTLLKPFLLTYAPLLAVAQLYSLPVFVLLHNWHELRMEDQEEQRAQRQAEPPPSVAPDVEFHAVR